MRRPSKLLEELEDKLVQKCGPWFDRHKKKFPVYIPLGLTAWYFYGMFLNSLKLGTALTFCPPGETPPESIWVLNPFKNWFALLTPFGLGVTAVVVLLICLITKKGYIWFSGYKYTHDARLRFSTLKRAFPDGHIEQVHGTVEENRAYIRKDGKWAADEKADTSVPGTFEEWGEIPEEPGAGYRTDISEIYEQIYNGASNAEIMSRNPEAAQYINKMDKIRQEILEAEYRDTWRDLTVIYIFGPTATGKTRYVMEAHGYRSVYRVTDYNHPFDRYNQEPVLCLDEYRSSLQIGDMLDYLDGYPLALPARYANRQACYETVYLISNIDLKEQYVNVQVKEPATWRAFLRRIHQVVEYRKDGEPIDHGPAIDYIFPPPPKVPEWVKEADEAEQKEIW